MCVCFYTLSTAYVQISYPLCTLQMSHVSAPVVLCWHLFGSQVHGASCCDSLLVYLVFFFARDHDVAEVAALTTPCSLKPSIIIW